MYIRSAQFRVVRTIAEVSSRKILGIGSCRATLLRCLSWIALRTRVIDEFQVDVTCGCTEGKVPGNPVGALEFDALVPGLARIAGEERV